MPRTTPRSAAPHTFSRRDALKVGGLSSLGLLIGGCSGQDSASAGPIERVPKNIIFMVSDGMSTGVLSLADSFSRIVRDPQRTTHWPTLMRRPEVAHGLVETHSLSSMVTDSAAAATAWGSGSRCRNGMINILPDGTALLPIARLLRDSGRRVGLVSTATITHATPAGFAAVQDKRNDEDQIAPQYLELVDVLMGGGREFFDPLVRKDGLDLIGQYSAAGYAFWDHRSRVLGPDRPKRILGIFGSGHLPYTLDHRNDSDLRLSVPTLAEMTRAAMQSLGDADKGFFLMVEGARIDHAAHANDAAGILWEQLAFDDAIGEVLHFMHDRDDTLLVITTDHGNSNPGLNGMGGAYGESTAAFERLAKCNATAGRMLKLMKDGGPDVVADVIRTHTSMEVKPEQAAGLAQAMAENFPNELNRQHASAVGALGQVLGNYNGIGWTGVSHTADYAMLTALGPGSDHFRGYQRNTDAYTHLTRMLKIEHVNPALKPGESWREARAYVTVPEIVPV